jgi:hypothetical protein
MQKNSLQLINLGQRISGQDSRESGVGVRL